MVIEHEGDAARFLAAMRAMSELLTSRVPGLQLDPEDLAGLIDLLASEAERVVPATRLAPRRCND